MRPEFFHQPRKRKVTRPSALTKVAEAGVARHKRRDISRRRIDGTAAPEPLTLTDLTMRRSEAKAARICSQGRDPISLRLLEESSA